MSDIKKTKQDLTKTDTKLLSDIRTLINETRANVARSLNNSINSLHQDTEKLKKPKNVVQNNPNELNFDDKITPNLIFNDSKVLSLLGLNDKHKGKEFKTLVLYYFNKFLLELGVGFAFVERQKRITVDGDDFYIDLLLYHRKLRRLVVIELKSENLCPPIMVRQSFICVGLTNTNANLLKNRRLV